MIYMYVCMVLIRHKSFDRIFFIFEFFNHKIRKMMTVKGEDEKYGRLLRSTVGYFEVRYLVFTILWVLSNKGEIDTESKIAKR